MANNLIIENAELIFRNFEGKETGKYNAEGDRNFCVILNPDIVNDLKNDGWNVRTLKPFYDDDDVRYYLQVAVNFNNYPPNIYIITSKGKTRIDEDDVKMLDWAEFKTVDLIIRPYSWVIGNKSGVKAYLKSMYVTIVEDEFTDKYSNVPDISSTKGVYDDVPF